MIVSLVRRAWLEALSEFERHRVRAQELAAITLFVPLDESRRIENEIERSTAEARTALDDAFVLCSHEGLGDDRDADKVYDSDKGDLRFEATVVAAPDELVLAYHRLPDSWVAFAQYEGGLRVRKLDCLSLDTRLHIEPDCLLAPFRDLLQHAARVRFLSVGPMNNVDLHALDNEGSPLVESVPVVYGIDLGGHEKATKDKSARALIVADTRGDLSAARDEAREVERILRERGIEHVKVLQGSDASLANIRREIVEADLLHYAGHAVYSGHGGWDSVLKLADGAELSVADVLTFERVPQTVVLSGCETARVADEDAPESLGLAQAFLVAGSSVVVAASRPVDDAVALDTISGMYRHWPEKTLERALPESQLRVRANRPEADWAAYRILVP